MNTELSFSERLNAAAERGKLSVRDLMVWFERPYQTVWSWCQGGTPQAYYREKMLERLRMLEKTFKQPLNPDIKQRKRKTYVKRLLVDAINARISKSASAS